MTHHFDLKGQSRGWGVGDRDTNVDQLSCYLIRRPTLYQSVAHYEGEHVVLLSLSDL